MLSKRLESKTISGFVRLDAIDKLEIVTLCVIGQWIWLGYYTFTRETKHSFHVREIFDIGWHCIMEKLC